MLLSILFMGLNLYLFYLPDPEFAGMGVVPLICLFNSGVESSYCLSTLYDIDVVLLLFFVIVWELLTVSPPTTVSSGPFRAVSSSYAGVTAVLGEGGQ